MKRYCLRLLTVAFLLIVATSAFAGEVECKACVVSSFESSSTVWCATPSSGEWGLEPCRITCTRDAQGVYCSCDQTWGCLYEVVQG